MGQDRIAITIDKMLKELIPRFLENRSKDIVLIRDAVARGDLIAAGRIGHSMKGVGGGYGFMEITHLGAAIELAAREGNAGDITARTADLESFLARIDISYE
jgi:HPt (histidine-containing phosphotransfer) domain-containing protein